MHHPAAPRSVFDRRDINVVGQPGRAASKAAIGVPAGRGDREGFVEFENEKSGVPCCPRVGEFAAGGTSLGSPRRHRLRPRPSGSRFHRPDKSGRALLNPNQVRVRFPAASSVRQRCWRCRQLACVPVRKFPAQNGPTWPRRWHSWQFLLKNRGDLTGAGSCGLSRSVPSSGSVNRRPGHERPQPGGSPARPR